MSHLLIADVSDLFFFFTSTFSLFIWASTFGLFYYFIVLFYYEPSINTVGYIRQTAEWRHVGEVLYISRINVVD